MNWIHIHCCCCWCVQLESIDDIKKASEQLNKQLFDMDNNLQRIAAPNMKALEKYAFTDWSFASLISRQFLSVEWSVYVVFTSRNEVMFLFWFMGICSIIHKVVADFFMKLWEMGRRGALDKKHCLTLGWCGSRCMDFYHFHLPYKTLLRHVFPMMIVMWFYALWCHFSVLLF